MYPACTCDDESAIFSALNNQCYHVQGSPLLQLCDDGYYYGADDVACKSNVERICPFDSIGIGADCLCVRKNHKFDSYSWICMEIGSRCRCNASIDWKVLRSSVG